MLHMVTHGSKLQIDTTVFSLILQEYILSKIEVFKLKLSKFTLAAIVFGYSQICSATEVTSPVIDGMVIEFPKESLQQAKIRVKSFGPGFCQVNITLAGVSTQLAAPPLVWSDWKPIGPGISGGSHKLSFKIGCDTGALGEVKYFND